MGGTNDGVWGMPRVSLHRRDTGTVLSTELSEKSPPVEYSEMNEEGEREREEREEREERRANLSVSWRMRLPQAKKGNWPPPAAWRHWVRGDPRGPARAGRDQPGEGGGLRGSPWAGRTGTWPRQTRPGPCQGRAGPAGRPRIPPPGHGPPVRRCGGRESGGWAKPARGSCPGWHRGRPGFGGRPGHSRRSC